MRFQGFTSLALAAMFALPLSATTESRPRTRTEIANRAPMSAESVVDAMNRERAARGLAPLRLNARLNAAAQDRARDMFAKHYFEHVSPDGIDPFSWVDREGYDYTVIGENLATGYGTATSVVDGWMDSPGHRENILERDFRDVGIAIAAGSPQPPYGGPLVVAVYGAQ